jgi:hypothetical protein
MTAEEEKTAPLTRAPLVTSRHLAIAAVFGGLGFAWRALGLVIPLVPPFVLDMRLPFDVIGAATGGPVAAIILGILYAIPSGLPIPDLYFYTVFGLFSVCLPYKKFYRFKSPWNVVAMAAWVFLTYSFILVPINLMLYAYVFRLFPFWPTLYVWYAGPTWVYATVATATIILLMTSAKKFAEPTWHWRRPK